MRDKVTGSFSGYCFLEFFSREEAKFVLENLNGKDILETNK